MQINNVGKNGIPANGERPGQSGTIQPIGEKGINAGTENVAGEAVQGFLKALTVAELHACAEEGKLTEQDILALKEKGIDIDEKSADRGMTALMFAINWGHVETVELLLQHGADVNARDKGNFTPLMTACFKGNAQVARKLLEYNPKIDAKGPEDNTALHYAAMMDLRNIVYLLLKAGANPTIENQEKKTPPEIASEFEYEKLMKLFRAWPKKKKRMYLRKVVGLLVDSIIPDSDNASIRFSLVELGRHAFPMIEEALKNPDLDESKRQFLEGVREEIKALPEQEEPHDELDWVVPPTNGPNHDISRGIGPDIPIPYLRF